MPLRRLVQHGMQLLERSACKLVAGDVGTFSSSRPSLQRAGAHGALLPGGAPANERHQRCKHAGLKRQSDCTVDACGSSCDCGCGSRGSGGGTCALLRGAPQRRHDSFDAAWRVRLAGVMHDDKRERPAGITVPARAWCAFSRRLQRAHKRLHSASGGSLRLAGCA
jgi:hypothetical protein